MVEGRRVLRAGTLIDGVGDDSLTDAGICIVDGKISAVGPWSDLSPSPAMDEAIDLTGFTVMPGLVDAHAHLSLFADGRNYQQMALDSDEEMLAAARRNAERHLEAGVTTVRDNGSRNRLGFLLKEAVAHGRTPGPRMLVCGRPVTNTLGHFYWCNGEVDDEEGIRGVVAELVREGADHIKIMASGGGTVGTDPRRPTYSVAELRAAVAAAHSLGRLTTAHCRALESMNRAVEAGIDCMEHADFLRPDGHMVFDDATAERLARSGMYLSPTLPAYGSDAILRLGQIATERLLTAEEAADLAAAEEALDSQLENFARMLEFGLADQIIGGTDAGCSDFSFGHMDYCLELMVQGGMGEMAAIKACTSVAARAVGLEGSVGSVIAGCEADLVVIDGDPLTDLKSVSEVRAVFQHGRCTVTRIDKLPLDS